MSVFKLLKEQLGGFYSLEIIKVTDVLSGPKFLTNENIHLLSYKTNINSDVKIMPVGESILVKSTPTIKKGSEYHTVNSSFEILFPDDKIDTLLYSTTKSDVILKANFHDGTSIFYGSVVSPLELSYRHDLSKVLESPHKTIVTIKGKTTQKPVFKGAI
jgi:hypothetical protein